MRIDLHVELVQLLLVSGDALVVLSKVAEWAGDIRSRIQRFVGKQVAGKIAEPADRDLVVRERLSGQRIADDNAPREQAAEIASPPLIRHDGRDRVRGGRVLASALVVPEEE